MKPLAVQLWSVREEAKADPLAVLRAIAEIGYKGVEPAGFYGWSAGEFKKVTDDLGLEISSSHGPWVRGLDDVQKAIDTAGVLGLDVACTGFGSEAFSDLAAIQRTAELVNSVVEPLARAGLKLFLHNHAWEFDRIDGKLKYDYLLEACPQAFLELDTYWAANFGAEDPAAYLARYQSRTLFLHIKDGPLEKDRANVAVGSGKMDIGSVIRAASPEVLRWLIVEFDRCDTPMLPALQASYRYLVENELGSGRV